MKDEAAILARVAVFGLIAGLAYWFSTYEWFGVLGLLVLGAGPGFAALWLYLQQRREPGPPETFQVTLRRFAGFPPRDPDEQGGYAADRLAVLPLPSIWPLVLSLGVAMLTSGLIYGLWLLLLGGALVGVGVWGWIAAVNRENRYGRLEAERQDRQAGETGSG
jgi:Cytochrome c oxidase subunit IV